MGKLGQMGGLMRKVREKWLTGGGRKRYSKGVSWRGMKRTRQSGQLFQGTTTHPGWAVLTNSSQTRQHGSRSRWICHCLMVSIKLLMRDLVLSITSDLGCHDWSPSSGCEDINATDFYITFASRATVGFNPQQASEHEYESFYHRIL